MLEHLRMRPLKKTKTTAANDNNPTSTSSFTLATSTKSLTMSTNSSDTIDDNPGTFIKGNRENQKRHNDNDDDDVDNVKVSVTINETRKISLKEIPNGTLGLLECEKNFDPKKRYSIGNGDLRNGKSYELSLTPRSMQRKLSADMRLRGSNNQLNDDYAIRRPVRLRSMATNFEVYDSLHVRAIDVSKYFVLIS